MKGMKVCKLKKCDRKTKSKKKNNHKAAEITTETKLKCKVKFVNNAINKKYVDGKVKKKIKIKRKCYTPEAIKKAMKAVSEGASLREAGKMHSVPCTTLHNKLKNPESVGKKGGPPTVLTADEENHIVEWLIYRGETGSPVSKSELLDCIKTYLSTQQKDTCFKNNRPGKKWYVNFTKRHPEISLRIAQNLPLVKASVIEEDLHQWFFLKKKKKSKKNNSIKYEEIEKIQSENNLEETNQQHLMNFENNIPLSLLNIFKSCEESKIWLGALENKGLFKYWLNLKNHISGTLTEDNENLVINIDKTTQLPTIKNNVKNVNIVLPQHEYLSQSIDPLEVEESVNILNASFPLTNINTNTTRQSPPNKDIKNVNIALRRQKNHSQSIEQLDTKKDSSVLDVSFQTTVEKPFPIEQVFVPVKLDKATIEEPILEEGAVDNEITEPFLENNLTKDTVVVIIPPDEYLFTMDNINATSLDSSVSDEGSLLNITKLNSQMNVVDNGIFKEKMERKRQFTAESTEENSNITLSIVQGNSLAQQNENFSQSFILPIKKKKTQLEQKGSKKLRNVGISERWLQIQVDKQQQQIIKQAKLLKKKKLLEQKKKLAEKKKRLSDEMKEIQKKIKQENI